METAVCALSTNDTYLLTYFISGNSNNSVGVSDTYFSASDRGDMNIQIYLLTYYTTHPFSGLAIERASSL